MCSSVLDVCMIMTCGSGGVFSRNMAFGDGGVGKVHLDGLELNEVHSGVGDQYAHISSLVK
jgi:hypothetical protein